MQIRDEGWLAPVPPAPLWERGGGIKRPSRGRKSIFLFLPLGQLELLEQLNRGAAGSRPREPFNAVECNSMNAI